jgi:hypothetical protein
MAAELWRLSGGGRAVAAELWRLSCGAAELWRLALGRRVRPERLGAGYLWSLA